MDFLEVINNRHSVRKFTDAPVEKEILDAIVSVARTAPSSRNSKSTEFMIVDDRDTIVAMSQMRDSGSAFMKDAAAVIVILGDESKTDLWVDNCAISATFVQLAVTAMDRYGNESKPCQEEYAEYQKEMKPGWYWVTHPLGR